MEEQAETAKPRSLRHHCIVRKELSPREKIVQTGHAAGESAVLGTAPNDTTIFVALEATLEEMTALMSALDQRGYKYVKVIEDVGPWAGQMVAIGIEPSRDNRLRKILYYLKQAGEETKSDASDGQSLGFVKVEEGAPHFDSSGRIKHYCSASFCPDFNENSMVKLGKE